MYLTYAEQADAVYVQFRRSTVTRTEELGDSVAVDYDPEGPLGVEFLNVSVCRTQLAAAHPAIGVRHK
jgi:uncharacterized protein YuzE